MTDEDPDDDAEDAEREGPRVPDPGDADAHANRSPPGEDTGDADAGEPLGDLASEVDDEGVGGREGPMSDVANEIDAPGERASPADQLFEEVEEVGEVDREALWRQVAGEEVAGDVEEELDAPQPEGPTVQRPDPDDEGVTVEDRHERIVEKAKYCQGCEYFSAPPDVRCTHEGTEIVEMVDVTHFRVVDCPVVKEDEELENV